MLHTAHHTNFPGKCSKLGSRCQGYGHAFLLCNSKSTGREEAAIAVRQGSAASALEGEALEHISPLLLLASWWLAGVQRVVSYPGHLWQGSA